MIVCVSILDKHRPRGRQHIGTYTFEIPYDGNSHFDFHAEACDVEQEPFMRPFVGRLMSRSEMVQEIGGVIEVRK